MGPQSIRWGLEKQNIESGVQGGAQVAGKVTIAKQWDPELASLEEGG